MTRRNLTLAAIAVLVLLAGLAFKSGWFASSPPLTVHLRCQGTTAGRVSITRLTETGESRGDKSFDLKTACASGKLDIDGYRSQENLRIKLDHDDGKASELIARYGANIQRDQGGFYTVLKITPTPPFIANDSI